MDESVNKREQRFVDYVLKRKKEDTGFAANFRRATNPDTEYLSWGALASLNVNLNDDRERLPFALIGAALCANDLEADGKYGLGAALAGCKETTGKKDASGKSGKDGDGSQQDNDFDDVRLRRLLACSGIREVCQILRPLLPFINGKSKLPLSHARLLADLLYFSPRNRDAIKRRWAMEFYGASSQPDADGPAES